MKVEFPSDEEETGTVMVGWRAVHWRSFDEVHLCVRAKRLEVLLLTRFEGLVLTRFEGLSPTRFEGLFTYTV